MSAALAMEAVSTNQPVPYDDATYKRILSDIKYLKRRLTGLVHNVRKETNQSQRRGLVREISMVGDKLRRLCSLSKVCWVRKVNKPERFLGIAKGRKFIKEMRGLYFPLSKGLILSHGPQSRRHRSSKGRRPFRWRRLSKSQHSKDPDPIWEDGSEDSHYAEGTALHKPQCYLHVAKGRKLIKEMRGIYFPLSKGLIFFVGRPSSRRRSSKRRRLFKWRRLFRRQHSKPALLESTVRPKRRRSSSPQDSYTSYDDESKNMSEDSSDAEDTFLHEVHSSTSEDLSDVEDPDVKDVEDPTNDEASTYVGEVEYSSSDVEFSSDGTTRFKPAPFIEKYIDEDPEVKEAIERHMKYYDRPSPEKDDCIDYLRLVSGDFGKHYLIAGPVLQVIAVHISSPNSKELNIHGHISVTDDKYNTYYIYNRLSECPEKVFPGREFLPLNRRPLLPLMWGNVEFCLKDGSDIIFERKVTVEYLSKYDDGHVRKLRFEGKDKCRATMYFTSIPYARIVEFRMNLWEPYPPPAAEAFRLHGRIKANKALCFRKTPEESLEMWQKFNHIGEFVLAVSVFSELLLDVKLYGDGKKLAYQVCRAPFYNYRSREEQYECYDKTFELHVALQWHSYSDYFEGKEWSSGICPQINMPANCSTVVYENEGSDSASVQVNKPINFPAVAYENAKFDCNPSSSARLNLESTTVTSDGPLVEIFSVLVGGGNSSVPLALCGTIAVRDSCGTFYIFSRNQDCPDKLSSSNKLHQSRTSLSLAWPWRCIVENKFFMHFKLEDACGEKVCRGSLDWCKKMSSGPYDTRICAIIPGENGYFAAVHFSVFKNGLKAKVTVECSSSKDGPNYNNDDHISVYGSIFAQYSNYNYPSTYDKKYYRSIIFNRSKEKGVNVMNGSKIPLSKSMVSAPSDCKGIIVDFDLLVISSGERRSSGRAIGRIMFKANNMGVCEMCDGDGGGGKDWRCADCHIKITVDWVK